MIHNAMTTRKEQIIQMLQENKNDAFLHYVLGLEYLSENNLSHAQQQFQKTIELDEQYTPAYYQLGLLLYKLNQKEESLNILNKGFYLSKEKQKNKDIAEFQSAITNIENELL